MLLVRGFAEAIVDCELLKNQVSLVVMTLDGALPSSEQQLSPHLD